MNLAFSLQTSTFLPEEKRKAIRTSLSKEVKGVRDYIEKFRSSLSFEISQDMDYSYKVFLVPKIGVHRQSSDIAVEFVHYDPSKPDEMTKYERVVSLIKVKQVPVANLGLLKPGHVVSKVASSIPHRFRMCEHTLAWKHYHARPDGDSATPDACNPNYCHYDSVHKDYLYTQGWVDFLIGELSDEQKCRRVTGGA